jgi:hypothetical protein
VPRLIDLLGGADGVAGERGEGEEALVLDDGALGEGEGPAVLAGEAVGEGEVRIGGVVDAEGGERGEE